MKRHTRLVWLLVLGLANCLRATDGKLQFSLINMINDANYRDGIMYLRIMPESVTHFGQILKGQLDTDVGADLRFDILGQSAYTKYPFTADLYRAWVRWSTPQLELRFGQQELNFGPARILRSLRWFDARDPLDPLSLIQGVNAVAVRYYWLNNTNIWGWGIYDATGSQLGVDPFRSQPGVWQSGGRFQQPLGSGNLALTIHERQINHFEDIEWRWALDGQWDLGVGVWFEAVRVQLSAEPISYTMDLATLGCDYTFGWGNGLYAMAEYQYVSSSATESKVKTAAVQLNYLLNLMDQLFVLSLYNNYLHFSANYLGWQRQYDRLSWQLLVGYVDKSLGSAGLTPIGLVGSQSLQLTLMYSI